jgi:hypothetical protein
MANVNCYGQLISNRGGVIPLLNASQTEASEEEVKTDLNYVGSAQSVGTFGTQRPGGFSLAKAGIVGENDITYAFIQSAGKRPDYLWHRASLEGPRAYPPPSPTLSPWQQATPVS